MYKNYNQENVVTSFSWSLIWMGDNCIYIKHIEDLSFLKSHIAVCKLHAVYHIYVEIMAT